MARILIGNIKGPKGDTGPQGTQGPTGPQGPKGDTGPMPALINNAATTSAGVGALDAAMGKTLGDQINVLNNKVTNKTTLLLDYCTNLLDYAESATEGFCYVVRLAGTGYTGNNLPTNGNYKYGSAIIMKRYANSMTILLFGSSYNEQIMINTWNINTNSWDGWYSVQENCMKTHQMDPFDFDNPTYAAGSYRLGTNNQNSPGDSLNYGNVFIARNNTSDTLAMLAFPFSNDGKIYYRQGNTEGWATAPWYYLQGIKIA